MKIFSWHVKLLLYLIPLTVGIVYGGVLFPFIVGKYTFFRSLISLAIVAFVWAWATERLENGKWKISAGGGSAYGGEKGKSFREQSRKGDTSTSFFSVLRHPLVIAVSVFVLLYVLAAVVGYDFRSSFWSNYERGEGALQMLFLWVFFALLVLFMRDARSWRKMFYISLVAAALMIIYGLLGAFGIGGRSGPGICERFAGSLGNSAYVGTYLLFIIFYASCLLVWDWRKTVRWLWLAAIPFFGIFLLMSQTRGALMGLGAGIVAALVYLAIVIPSKRAKATLAIVAVALVCVGVLGIVFRQYIDLMPFCNKPGQSGNRILDVSLKVETYQTRLALWKASFNAFLDRPLLGWGPENVSVALERYFQPIMAWSWFDRAHNIFFDYLVMGGALGFLSFIGIYATLAVVFFKHRFRGAGINQPEARIAVSRSTKQSDGARYVSDALVVGIIIAYLVQGFVLFDVLSIYINLFIVLAFAVARYVRGSQLINEPTV